MFALMNSAPAELLQLLTTAALQPFDNAAAHWDTFASSGAPGSTTPSKILLLRVSLGGRSTSSYPFRTRHRCTFACSARKKKPPGLTQFRRGGLQITVCVVCISVRTFCPVFLCGLRQLHTPKKSACITTRFQVRKVHENLIEAQRARMLFIFFFCSDQRGSAHWIDDAERCRMPPALPAAIPQLHRASHSAFTYRPYAKSTGSFAHARDSTATSRTAIAGVRACSRDSATAAHRNAVREPCAHAYRYDEAAEFAATARGARRQSTTWRDA